MKIKQTGFTLVELLVVITIIAVIATIGLATYSNAQIAARDAKRKNDLRSISISLELYKRTNQLFPIGTYSSTTSTNWIPGFEPRYINNLPRDPANNATFHYRYDSAAGTDYILCANLENNNDPEGSSPGSNPCVGDADYMLENID